jgi:hypothetical protein
MAKTRAVGCDRPARSRRRLRFVATGFLFAMATGLVQPQPTLAAVVPHRIHRASGNLAGSHFATSPALHPWNRKPPQPAMDKTARRPVKIPNADQAGKIPRLVVQALRVAQQATTIDPYLLLAIAWKESSFNSEARNKHSSARGLLQFTTTTWLTVVRDFGAQNGLAHYAASINTDRDGRLSVTKPRLRRAILALRDNPNLQAIMAVDRLEQERKSLEDRLGRPARAADLYFLHLLGPTGARRFLEQLAEAPDTSSVDVVGSVAVPNLGMFTKDGRSVTVAEAYAGVQTTLDDQASRYATLFEHARLTLANTN